MSEKPDQQKEPFYIVGIGASAGGVQALKEFFENTPPGTGIAWVVILHLSPDHDSHLAQLLQTVTAMPVQQVVEKVKVLPDQVYVIPPNQHLMMEDGMLAVSLNMQVEDRRAPVDIFFRTLAESHTTRAIAVVLSGTGANGSMGMKRVKEKGGAVFVQNPREAEFSEMPRNSIATELVDEVLPVADIPGKIISYTQSQVTVHIPLDAAHPQQDQQQALREIFTQLRLRTGHDFSNYKRPTLLRRIERRMSIHNLPDLPAYTAYLQQHPDEITNLLKDLLISVTNFFRDKRAFEELENEVLPLLFQGKTAADPVRIWVAACATGEEAYTLAMLCAERTNYIPDSPQVQIFATDIDETAIAIAREGLYSLNDAADVSAERLRRFFTKEGDDYRIRREIREMVLFASHNFLKDPPFSHLHLITCRNVLIYLNHTAQERVMETFHFALNPGGYLLLGNSESADSATDLYSTVSREHHIYQTRQVGNRTYPVPDAIPSFRRTEQPVPAPTAAEGQARTMDRITYGDLHQRLLEEYAPPSMVVNEEYDIVHVSERAGRYLQISGGELSRNLLKLVRPELRLELRSALYQATQRKTPVEAKGLQLRIEDATETLNLQVRPVMREGDTAKGFMLVVFSPAEPGTPEVVVYTSDEPAARHLEEELVRLKAQLRTSNEHHEFQAEELKAANEELQAMNEEMRSAAEELETSKEELQSINEELTTVNQELKVKVEEVSMANNNLQNLINSTDLGTIFLDRSFRVVLFTPSTRSIFNLIPADYGRPLSDITSKLLYDDVIADAEQVLDRLLTIEREVQTTDERVFLMRMLPYRTAEDRIKGVVITFIDITERKQAEQTVLEAEKSYGRRLEEEVAQRTEELEQNKNLLQATIDNSLDMIQVFEAVRNVDGAIIDFRWVLNNRASGKNYKKEVIGASLLQQNPGVVAEGIFDTFKQVVETGIPSQQERQYVHEQFDGWFYQAVVKMGDGVSTTTADITERKKAEQEILQLKDEIAQKATDRYLRLFNSIDEGFYQCEVIFDENNQPADILYLEENPAALRLIGQSFVGKTLRGISPLYEDYWYRIWGEVAITGISQRLEQYSEADKKWFDFFISKMGGPESHQVTVVFQDVTERKQQETKRQYLLKLSDVLRPLVDPTAIQGTAARVMMEQLKADRCYYCEIEGDTATIRQDAHRPDLPSVATVYDMANMPAFKSFLQTGEPLVVTDIHTTSLVDEELRQLCIDSQIVAFINLPVIKNKVLEGRLCITQATPRQWTGAEVELAQETAERTWAAVERAKTEEALQESEERLRLATIAASIYSWQYDIATGKYSFSTNAATILGIPPERLPVTIEDAYQLVHPEDRYLLDELPHAIATQTGFFIDFRSVKENGEIVWLSVQSTYIPSNGNLARVVGIAQDISERKNAEEALRLAEERYRTVLESAELGAWDWDITADRVVWNKEHYTLLGADEKHYPMNSAYFMHFIHPDDAERIRNVLYEAVASKGVYDADFRIIRGDNAEVRWMSGFGRVADEKDGQATRMVGVMSDITARKQAEQQREDFLSIASHELKTPVTSIKAYGQLLQESFETGGDARNLKMMNKLNLQVDRLTNLITSLLDTTKISEGQLALNLTAFDYNELIADRVEDLQRLSPLHRLIIEFCPNVVINADRERISQVVINLVGNAIKYSPPNTEIHISCQVQGDSVRLSVKDQGIGIPEEVQQKVFGRFFRVKDVRMKTFPGLGLGLYITAGIVQRHGGTIGLESKVGEGSTFWFELPLGKEEEG